MEGKIIWDFMQPEFGENAILNFPEDYTGERECGINVLRDKFRL